MRQTLSCPLVLAVLLLLLPLVACRKTEHGYALEPARAEQEAREAGREAGRALEQGATELQRRAEPLLEDAALTAKIKAKLAADPEVSAFRIDVDTLERVVTLSGRVESDAVRAEAEKLARQTAGVQGVINNLLVGDQPIAAGQPVAPATPSPGAPTR